MEEYAHHYLVSFYVDNELYQTVRVKEGETVGDIIEAPTKDDYNFVGWQTSDGVAFDLNATVINSSLDVYAKFELKSKPVTSEDEASLNVTDTKDPTKDYFLVIGWYGKTKTSGLDADLMKHFYLNKGLFWRYLDLYDLHYDVIICISFLYSNVKGEKIMEDNLKKHYEWKGKIEIKPRVDVFSKESLSMAYTPGVAEACMKIHENKDESFNLTRRWNVVPVITDGTAVLGLGDIGPEAGMPVMEGKCALFKAYGDVDAIPLCIRSKDSEEIIKTIELLAGSFGGINLEDIAAPRCFEIEKRLKEDLDIPVFHDDQHGTAIVTLAALINALKLAKKDIADIKIVINGAGAAGVAIAKLLLSYGAKHIICCDSKGIIKKGDPRLNESKKGLAEVTNLELLDGKLEDAMKNSDVFIGVSVAHCVTKDMVRSMNKDPILFTCANPIPEILPEESYEAGAFIVGTGSSEYPNQINNVLVFPGLFRGAIDAKANTVNLEMMKAAALGIASCVKDNELNRNYILPVAWDKVAHLKVADEVKKAAIRTGAIRK